MFVGAVLQIKVLVLAIRDISFSINPGTGSPLTQSPSPGILGLLVVWEKQLGQDTVRPWDWKRWDPDAVKENSSWLFLTPGGQEEVHSLPSPPPLTPSWMPQWVQVPVMGLTPVHTLLLLLGPTRVSLLSLAKSATLERKRGDLERAILNHHQADKKWQCPVGRWGEKRGTHAAAHMRRLYKLWPSQLV